MPSHPDPDPSGARLPSLLEVALEGLEERLLRQADLFTSPDAYRAGVEDALAAVQRMVSGDAPPRSSPEARQALGRPPPSRPDGRTGA